MDGSLGIAVAGNVITAVHTGGAGERAGLLIDDEIVEVNGRDAQAASFGSLLPKDHEASIRLRLKRVVHVAAADAAPKPSRKRTTSVVITLQRVDGSLGIAVADNVITAVHTGGAGERAGLLVDDEIVEVNGRDAQAASFGSLLPKDREASIQLRLKRTEQPPVIQSGGGLAQAAEADEAQAEEDDAPADEVALDRAQNALSDHSLTDDPAAAQKLYVGRLAASLEAGDGSSGAEPCMGVVVGAVDDGLDDSSDVRFCIDYPDAPRKIVHLEVLQRLLIPFSDMTEAQLNATDLASSALRAELQARGIRFHDKLGKKRLAALLFSELGKARELASKQIEIAAAVDSGMVEGDAAKGISDAAYQADVEADEAAGEQTSPADAPTGEATSKAETAPLSQAKALVNDYNAKQVSELSALMGVVMSATSRVKAVRELLDTAQSAGLVVTPSLLTAMPFTNEPARECSADELGAQVAARAVAGGLARISLDAARASKVAVATRQQITEVFNAQRKPADKLLTFMLGDFQRHVSMSIARFAVSANMPATVLDELVDKVLSETSRLSDGALNTVIERGDGATVNLVREGRATRRSSTARGDNVEGCHAVDHWQFWQLAADQSAAAGQGH